MKKEEIDKLIEKYDATHKVANLRDAGGEYVLGGDWPTMYDNRSAAVNYAMVRHYQPEVVVEYGSYMGRCTHDILRALIDNNKPYVFKPYELSETRNNAQNNINKVFGDKAIKIGGDVMEATDIPESIDYLFLDHSHNDILTTWTWEKVLPRVKKGGLIQIHDIPLKDDMSIGKSDGVFPETRIIVDMYQKGILPFEKLYFLFPECGAEGSWWIKK
jgi:predicted O-methyltransferase YrrM